MKFSFVFVSLFLVFSVAALAADEAVKPPHPDVARNLKFAGNWSGTTTVNIVGGPSGTGMGTMKAEVVGGNAVRGNIAFDVPNVGKFSGEWMLGVDNDTGMSHMFIVTNEGATHDHTGTWINDNVCVFHVQASVMGVITTEDFTFTFVSPNELRFDERDNMQNGTQAYFTGTFKK